ncbi:MAG: class I SAM-dependent methyltransferase [Sphaerochaetaceae bacterium]|jgi:23S rRNA (guanine2445-N2)-methyltransferase / 23S rRNA (guanine2069-N7)-methyltransferase|nr:class I SAM-dependent methyltransferase [Sphaerochaetaceae bacterium]
MQFFEKDFGKILKKNALEMRRAFNKSDSDCGRVYDRNLAQFPVTVDIYADYARITDYSDEGLSDELSAIVCDICRRMLYIERDKVVIQRRPKREGHEQHEVQSPDPLFVNVRENGHVFKVDLTSRVDTGLFLDQVNNRMMIQEQSGGRDVLNLFSYTGSFSVYAACGGAKSVTSVDLSNTYTTWALENLKENGYEGDMYRCIADDAKHFVSEAIKRKEKYDIIVFDPPCFSNSRKMDYDFDVQRDYEVWLTGLSHILRDGGFILFSTNLATFGMDGRLKRRNCIREITAQNQAQGFTCRIGSARSWILEKDEEKLTLDWDDSAPVKKTRVRKSVKKDAAPAEVAGEVSADVEMNDVEKTIEESVCEDCAVCECAEAEVPAQDAEVAADDDEIADTAEDAAAESAEDSSDDDDDQLKDEDLNTASDDDVEEEADDDTFGQNEWKGDDDAPGHDRNSDRRDDRRSSDDRYPRGGRDSYGDRDRRSSYGRDRSDRPSYGRDRDSRGGRDSFRDRDSRGGRDFSRDRSDRPSYGRDRDDRPSFGRDRDRSDRPSFGRDRDRDSRGGRDFSRDRSDRPSYDGRDRSDRPSFGRDRDRSDRPSYGRDRDSRGGRDFSRDRSDRPSYGRDRDDRPSFGRDRDRDSRGGRDFSRDRSDRPSYGRDRDRSDRPSFRDRSDRPSFRDRDSSGDRRGGYGGSRGFSQSSDRGSRKPYGYDSFKPARDRNDSKQFFWLDDDEESKDK